MKLPLTNNWMQGTEDLIGQIEFMDSAKANFICEMLKMRPDSFKFEIGYSVDNEGRYTLHEVSIVNKYPQYHPVILKRRGADWLRRTGRKLKTWTVG